MTSKKMNDLDKAVKLIADKNTSLIKLSRKHKIPYQSLKNLRQNPAKLKKTSWERVHLFAQIYDKTQEVQK